MKSYLYPLLALLSLVCAAAAWVGVWYMNDTLNRAVAQHAQLVSESEHAAVRDATQARTRALALDTADARARLASLVHADVIASAKVIEAVGSAAKVSLKVSGAFPEQVPVVPQGSAHPLHAVGFAVEATGSFSSLLKAAQLLAALPLPSTLQQFDISLVPDISGPAAAPRWKMTARVRLFTDSDIPS